MTPFPPLRRPLVAILRGLRPEEADAVAAALIEAGIEALEIPLNSPDPFRSVEIAARLAPPGILVGAGTVLTVEDVARLDRAGGRLMVAPNVAPEVIRAATALGMVTAPGVFTATEALAAAAAGASALKIFPASALGPAGVRALRAVLPPELPVMAVGGVAEGDFAAWGRAGIRAFGLGTSLYTPGATAAETGARARAALAAWDATFGATA